MNKEKFLKELEKLYPEKYFVYMGLGIDNDGLSLLIDYLEGESINVHSFDPNKYKVWSDCRIQKFNLSSISLVNGAPYGNGAHVGDLVLDTTTNSLKVFDGTNWTEISST